MESGLRLLDPEDGEDTIGRNFGNCLVAYMAQCPKDFIFLRMLYIGAWHAQMSNESWGMVVGTAVLCIWLVSDTVSYLVSDMFPFTKMGIFKSSGMLHRVDW